MVFLFSSLQREKEKVGTTELKVKVEILFFFVVTNKQLKIYNFTDYLVNEINKKKLVGEFSWGTRCN